ncbi:MAG: hypothetical protein WA085_10035 [Sphingobium sp.]|uniref:hypothetical protein n=1 Tax=Sphingobium sp. CECT 9361 TaxID=2845384 RepID=UPI001E634A0A|nr:hypothetical protein [Sphingobium sp. CECT 9361]CAH0349357.1 hypothetical protein SPH9361_00565 [Sphingobium sp. CECT 9361]
MTAQTPNTPPFPDADPDNSEQADSGQAQDVAADARRHGTEVNEESERGGKPDRTQIIPDDVPDLVDTMNAMVSSGHIDNGAYAGEPKMDDEEDIMGETDRDEDE